MMKKLAAPMNRLEKRLRGLDRGGGLAVACSGGLDSRFLVHACRYFGLKVLALHFTGLHLQKYLELEALDWFKKNGIPHLRLEVSPLDLPEVRHNSPQRCYYCKKNAFTAMLAEVRNNGLELPLCDGTLASDFLEYRPGIRALRELGVHSPLAEAGLAKPEVRGLALALDLDNPAQPGQTCLLTRFDYGLTATPELLGQLAAAEEDLAETLHLHYACLPEYRQAGVSGACGVALSLPAPDPLPLHLPGALKQPGNRIGPEADQQTFQVRTPGPEPEFRLRLLAGELSRPVPELHLGLDPPGLDQKLLAVLKKCLARHGLERAAIRAVPELSGFFDRERSRRNEAKISFNGVKRYE